MSDTESTTSNAADSMPPPPSEIEEKPQVPREPALKNPSATFSIWPPSKRTREAVVTRLIETLSAPSMLSKRYGTIPAEEAVFTSRTIEEEAFAVAAGSAAAYDDGIEILQIYSKEVSKRMLETVKSRTASPAPVVTSADGTDQSSVSDSGPTHTASEEVASTVESEA